MLGIFCSVPLRGSHTWFLYDITPGKGHCSPQSSSCLCQTSCSALIAAPLIPHLFQLLEILGCPCCVTCHLQLWGSFWSLQPGGKYCSTFWDVRSASPSGNAGYLLALLLEDAAEEDAAEPLLCLVPGRLAAAAATLAALTFKTNGFKSRSYSAVVAANPLDVLDAMELLLVRLVQVLHHVVICSKQLSLKV